MQESLQNDADWIHAARHNDSEKRDDRESKHEVCAAYLAHDEQSAEKHEGEERQIAADPPGGRLADDKRRERDAECRRIEDMLLANGEDIFGCHRPRRRKDEETDTRIIRGSNRRDDEREDKTGNVNRLHIRRGAESFCEYRVRGPAYGKYEQR